MSAACILSLVCLLHALGGREGGRGGGKAVIKTISILSLGRFIDHI